METIEFNGKEYPKFQSEGNAAKYAVPFAENFTYGDGVDVGCNRLEWRYPHAKMVVDPSINDYHAMNIPFNNSGESWDYIFSSHCLEHVKENWYNVLDYWLTCIRDNGIIFLYLPHKSQEYWLAINNRKHMHSFDGTEIADYLRSLGHKVLLSGVDLNNSFVVVCEKIPSK